MSNVISSEYLKTFIKYFMIGFSIIIGLYISYYLVNCIFNLGVYTGTFIRNLYGLVC